MISGKLFSLHRRPLIPGGHDPELIWGSVLAAGGVIVAAWLYAGLPTPPCPLHSLTGIPCPTCGMTRGLKCLLHGEIVSAFLFNPLMMTVLFGSLLYVSHAAVVVFGGFPRFRFEPPSKSAATALRIGSVILILANWSYLILRERAVVGL